MIEVADLPPRLLADLRAASGFVLDVDGTLVLRRRDGDVEPLPGAVELLSALRRCGFPFCLLTNGTFQLPEEQAETLRGHGLDVADDEVLNPAVIAGRYLARQHPDVAVYVLAGEAVAEPLRRAGVRVVGTDRADEAGAVLVGWDVDLTHARLVAALQVARRGALFFATTLAPSYAGADGEVMSVAGALAAGIGQVTGRRATPLGKPASRALHEACDRLGVPAARVAVVGDDTELEVAMARRGGATPVLVRTGISAAADDDGPSRDPAAGCLTVPTVGDLTSLLAMA